jgi:hypothetical protein
VLLLVVLLLLLKLAYRTTPVAADLSLGVDDAQQWVFDDESGHIVARGIELALTAGATDVTLAEVDQEDDDNAAQKWHVALTGHVLLLRNGKSLAFAYAKEGMPVRVMPTAQSVPKQVWVFGATPSPTALPTHAPTPPPRHAAATPPGRHKPWWPVAASALAAALLLLCGGWWAFRALVGGGAAAAPKANNKPAKRRKLTPKDIANMAEPDEPAINPFGSRGLVEMSAVNVESEEDDEEGGEDGDDTAPLVAPNSTRMPGGHEPIPAAGAPSGHSWFAAVQSMFVGPEGGPVDTALPGDEEDGHVDRDSDDDEGGQENRGNKGDKNGVKAGSKDDGSSGTAVFAEGDEFVSFRDDDDDEDGDILEGEDLEPSAPIETSAYTSKAKHNGRAAVERGGSNDNSDGDDGGDGASGGGSGEMSGDEGACGSSSSPKSGGKEGTSREKKRGGKKKKKDKPKKGAKDKGSKKSSKGKTKGGSSEEEEDGEGSGVGCDVPLPPLRRRGRRGGASSSGSSSNSSDSEDDVPACMRGDFSPQSSSGKLNRTSSSSSSSSSSSPKNLSPEGTRGPNAFGGKARRALPTKDADEAMLDDFVA